MKKLALNLNSELSFEFGFFNANGRFAFYREKNDRELTSLCELISLSDSGAL
jgi:hypothetical protein